MNAYVVTRDVSPQECHWLAETVTKGTTVHRCTRPTYGCVDEFPATLDPDGGYPFFELPWDAIEPKLKKLTPAQLSREFDKAAKGKPSKYGVPRS
jgi:hypothetical protein